LKRGSVPSVAAPPSESCLAVSRCWSSSILYGQGNAQEEIKEKQNLSPGAVLVRNSTSEVVQERPQTCRSQRLGEAA